MRRTFSVPLTIVLLVFLNAGFDFSRPPAKINARPTARHIHRIRCIEISRAANRRQVLRWLPRSDQVQGGAQSRYLSG